MNDLDPEVEALCAAINGCRGLRTVESCCGHGERPFRIWFEADMPRSMYPLLRVLDPRYGGPHPCWTVTAQSSDLAELPVMFMLESPNKGQSAYDEAALLAKGLTDLLGRDDIPALQDFSGHPLMGLPPFKARLGVDSGQMAVLAMGYAPDSGYSGHIQTFALAGQTFKAWTVVDGERTQSLIVADALHSDGLFVDYSDEVVLNFLGEFSFNTTTQLFICDPCYYHVGPKRQQDPLYDTICDLPANGGLVRADGKTFGVSTNTAYGDGTYEATYALHPSGALKYVQVFFGDDAPVDWDDDPTPDCGLDDDLD